MEPETKERATDWVVMVRGLSLEDRMQALFHYVRQSGLANMAMEAGKVVLYAQCLGVYIGLLHIADYDRDDAMWTMGAMYGRYMAMRDDEHAHHEMVAGMLPFGVEYLRIIDEYKQFGGQDQAPTVMTPAQALRVAVFVMRWVGQEVHRQRLRQHKETALWMQDFAARRMPQLTHAGADAASIMYGVAEFERFIEAEKNRTALIDAVDREENVIIDLSSVAHIMDYGAAQPCAKCGVTRDYCCWSPQQQGRVYCSPFCYRLAGAASPV